MKKRIRLISMIFLILILPGCCFSQDVLIDLKKDTSFMTYGGWLPDFKDTIKLTLNKDKIPNRTKYCVVSKLDKDLFDLYCWTGIPQLEQPTRWKNKLKVKSKDRETINFQFGKKRYRYSVFKRDSESFDLIKIKQ